MSTQGITWPGQDVFSSQNLNWDPRVLDKGLDDLVMNKIVWEMTLWLQQEQFDFPGLPQFKFKTESVQNVTEVTSLLFKLNEFLKAAETSENETVQKLISSAFHSEDTKLKYIWWNLSNTDNEENGFPEIFLGSRLFSLLRKYNLSRGKLVESVRKNGEMIETWAGAFSNGEAINILEEVLQLLRDTRHNFQNWIAAVWVESVKKDLPKLDTRVLSIRSMLVEMQKWKWQMYQTSSHDIPSLLESMKISRKDECSTKCVESLEYLHFTRGQNLQQPDLVPCVTNPTEMSSTTKKRCTSESDSGISTLRSSLSSPSASDVGSIHNLSNCSSFNDLSACLDDFSQRRHGSVPDVDGSNKSIGDGRYLEGPQTLASRDNVPRPMFLSAVVNGLEGQDFNSNAGTRNHASNRTDGSNSRKDEKQSVLACLERQSHRYYDEGSFQDQGQVFDNFESPDTYGSHNGFENLCMNLYALARLSDERRE